MLKSTFVDRKEAEGGVLNKKTRALPAGEETPEGGGARVTGGGTEKKKQSGEKKKSGLTCTPTSANPLPLITCSDLKVQFHQATSRGEEVKYVTGDRQVSDHACGDDL